MKRKKLKGFTLAELVVVIALFGMIIAVALGLLEPVRRINVYAQNTADSQTIGEELRRYIEDRLQYANRVAVYTDLALTDDPGASPGSIQNEVKKFRDLYKFDTRTAPYSGFADTVYVMHIDNNDNIADIASSGTQVGWHERIGTVTIRTFVKGVENTDARREWEAGPALTYYDQYAFNIDLGTLVPDTDPAATEDFKVVPLHESTKTPAVDKDGNPVKVSISPNNFIFSIDMYRKSKVGGDINHKTISSTNIRRNVSFRLKNVVNSANAIFDEKIPFDDKAVEAATAMVKKFNWYDNNPAYTETDGTVAGSATGTNDVYIIYTNSINVEKVLE